ncbi:putative signal transducing protein [Arcticibacter sp. MXS-1]|uniref:putative signal transducing protein n=1 Tax=Arcticibacter sp. MXS-1 TaxID=3341726 RepID=UPI0035A9970B
MNSEWVKVYTSTDYFKSEIVKQVLTENEVEAVLMDKSGFPYKIGEVEVYVHADNEQRAKDIIISSEL